MFLSACLIADVDPFNTKISDENCDLNLLKFFKTIQSKEDAKTLSKVSKNKSNR